VSVCFSATQVAAPNVPNVEAIAIGIIVGLVSNATAISGAIVIPLETENILFQNSLSSFSIS